jgi:hypothetical protein
MFQRNRPAYLRLGKCEKPKWATYNQYGSFRTVALSSSGNEIIACGSIAGKIWGDLASMYEEDYGQSIHIISELPQTYILKEPTLVVEEHVRQGGLGQILGSQSINAVHFPSDKYGNQQWMREQAGLTAENIIKVFNGEISCG